MKTRMLPCKLTAEELAAEANHLALSIDHKEHIVSDQTSQKKRMKEEVDGLIHKISRLADIVRLGLEVREVNIFEEKNFERGFIVTRREDTGEVIDQREIRPEDRQVELPQD